ncbi:tetratricopeptide repeat protein [Thalassotalea nanhaiensis]|uniref:Tetratricopeptide repeat protein n=1 Tax=Thalassotalea nanhaiensis TaxID=3065648 RepID=A0ABY9TN55_9GAMM|nr:tetratricopeptide repeat protein [Colwelliaceae bacterium SQ345]
MVEPHVFDLILYLIEHRSRLVSRDELFKNLWAGREVCDATLSNNIKCARAALGDDGEKQSIIKTTRGRGYQFIAEIELASGNRQLNISLSSINATFQFIFTALGFKHNVKPLVAVSLLFIFIISYIWLFNSEKAMMDQTNIPKQKSIAVLPFKNHSDLEKDAFFTRGVHDDLLVHISKISAVKSISRSSVMTYQNSSKNLQTIGKELGVTTILQGSVQRATEQIRINVHLVNALNNENIWSESYTRKLTAKNVFDIQEEIAKTIAAELETTLSPKELAYIEKLPTQNLPALEAYFRAKESSTKHTHDGNQQAIVYLEEAVRLDPNFATAYALLANLHVGQIYWTGLPVEEQIVKAKSLIAIAMKLDSNDSELHRAIGSLKSYEQNFSAADSAYQKAINLNPNNAEAYASYGSLFMKYKINIPKAITLFAKAYSLNPKDDGLVLSLAQGLIFVGRFEEAKNIVKDVIARNPTYAIAHTKLAFISFFGEQNISEALRSLYKTVELEPNVPFNSLLVGMTLAHLGEKKLASSWFNRAVKLAPKYSGANHGLGMMHALNGDYNASVDSYLKVSRDFWLANESMYNLMKASLQTQRAAEVIEYYQNNYPEFFQADAKVDQSNYAIAFTLGRLLKKQGQTEQADRLLKASLKAAQFRMHGSWTDLHNNWEAKIYLAMGNEKAALKAFTNIVEEGWHSEKLVTDPDYNVFRDDPKFQTLQRTMKIRLNKEREKFKNMRINGEIFPFHSIQ